MLGIIRSIRLPECTLVVLLGFFGFAYGGIPVDALTLVTLFSVISATMLQNDWKDRIHDLGKGKVFASKTPRLFFTVVLIFWLICLGLVSWSLVHNLVTGSILLCMSLIGFFYSEARHVPILSLTLVTITVTSSVLLSLGFGAPLEELILLALCTGLIMLGRENLHDIGDTQVDVGYKKTLPVVFGPPVARIISTLTLGVGGMVAITVSTLNIPGALCIVWGISKIMSDERAVSVRKWVDIGLVLLVIGFIGTVLL